MINNDDMENMARLQAMMNDYLPEWASRRSTDDLEINQQLCTRDGRRIGNAVIACQVSKLQGNTVYTYWAVLTDMGTVLNLLTAEIDELFYRGDYIMKAADVQRRYAKATGISHV